MKTGKLFREMDLIAKRRGLFKVSIELIQEWPIENTSLVQAMLLKQL